MSKQKFKFPSTLVYGLIFAALVGMVMAKRGLPAVRTDADPTPMFTATLSEAGGWFAPSEPTSMPTLNSAPTISALQTETRRQQVELEANNITMLQLQADQDSRDLQRAQMTQAVESTAVAGTQVSAAYTATAFNTSVSLTSTAESNQATATAAFYTATAYAPTLEAAVIQADADRRFAPLDHIIRMGATIAFGFFAVAMPIALFLLRTAPIKREAYTSPIPILDNLPTIVPMDTKPVADAPVNVVVTKNAETAFVQADFYTLPCTAAMLTEWADAILRGAKTTGINEWEGRDTLWTRAAYRQFRQWLVSHRLAQWGAGGTLVIPSGGDLESILYGWLDSRELPKDYEFTKADVENKNTDVTSEMILQLGRATA